MLGAFEFHYSIHTSISSLIFIYIYFADQSRLQKLPVLVNFAKKKFLGQYEIIFSLDFSVMPCCEFMGMCVAILECQIDFKSLTK